MGQAFRRASGKVRTTTITNTPTPTPTSAAAASQYQKPFDQRPPAVPLDVTPSSSEDGNAKEVEERDPQFDAMLSQMVGRVKTKPGGKPEMGEAFVVQKSNRALPKVRNNAPDSGRYEERPVAAGTLNVAQLRRIMLLHEGKADDHNGRVDLKDIADTFRVDAAQLQKIFQHVSLPPDDGTSK